MAKLSIDCKKLVVKEVSDRLNDKDILIITNYRGLSAQDLNELRRELRNISGEYVVVKDSMVKRALAEGPNNRITEFIEGEVGIAIDERQDPTYISKVLVRFSKDHKVLKIRGGIMKGEMLSTDDIKALAALPSRRVLLGKLANVLNAPIQGLAGALHAIISKVVYALNAVKDKKEETGDKVQVMEEEVERAEEKKEGEQPEKKETGQPEKQPEEKEEAPAEKKEEKTEVPQAEKKQEVKEEDKEETTIEDKKPETE